MHAALQSTLQLLKRGAIRSTLNTMGHVGLGAPAGHQGRGLIMTLHRVEPANAKSFQPNALLSITPEYLRIIIDVAKQQNMQPIAVCDIKAYLASGDERPFIAFTLDDAYKNNRDFAAPIFRAHKVPYTIFVSKGLSERTHTLWWETTETLIETSERLDLEIASEKFSFPARSLSEKYQAFSNFSEALLKVPEDDAIAALNDAARQQGISAHALTDALIMDKDALISLNKDPLCHLAPHTVSHVNLAKISAQRLQQEIEQSVEYIQALTGETPSSHVFSYPYGKPFATSAQVFKAAQNAGMDYGVVTTPGAISEAITGLEWMHLPRMSINGYYQSAASAHALLCGVPTLLERKKRA